MFLLKLYMPTLRTKHTLHITGDRNDGQSLVKACSQVSAIKRIQREPRFPGSMNPYFKTDVSLGERPDWPPIMNPIFGAILARQVKENRQGRILEPAETTRTLVGACLGNSKPPPDMIVAGDSNLIIPCVSTEQGPIMHSPFYVEGATASLEVMQSKDLAFASGICILLYALDTIQLSRMPWETVINDGFRQGRFDCHE